MAPPRPGSLPAGGRDTGPGWAPSTHYLLWFPMMQPPTVRARPRPSAADLGGWRPGPPLEHLDPPSRATPRLSLSPPGGAAGQAPGQETPNSKGCRRREVPEPPSSSPTLGWQSQRWVGEMPRVAGPEFLGVGPAPRAPHLVRVRSAPARPRRLHDAASAGPLWPEAALHVVPRAAPAAHWAPAPPVGA